ncbi:hypothetical protein C8R48DRAFT_762406 [Suillus tomentosus]|nr:hypothetical protein C8R48DRAFT_762406 [Suillus tomentosus]
MFLYKNYRGIIVNIVLYGCGSDAVGCGNSEILWLWGAAILRFVAVLPHRTNTMILLTKYTCSFVHGVHCSQQFMHPCSLAWHLVFTARWNQLHASQPRRRELPEIQRRLPT